MPVGTEVEFDVNQDTNTRPRAMNVTAKGGVPLPAASANDTLQMIQDIQEKATARNIRAIENIRDSAMSAIQKILEAQTSRAEKVEQAMEAIHKDGVSSK